MFIYKEYCDADAYGEEILIGFPSKADAVAYLTERVENFFGQDFDEIELSDEDTIREDYVSYNDGNGVHFWAVTPLTERRTNMSLYISLFNGNMGDPTEFEGITAVVHDCADGHIILKPTAEQKRSATINTFGETEIFSMPSLFPLASDDMYVVTNRRREYGASAILNRRALKENLESGDYVALPSSVHEWILLKDDGSIDFEECCRIVREINGTDVVKDNEILADRAYRIKI